jgi:hypothetical protein
MKLTQNSDRKVIAGRKRPGEVEMYWAKRGSQGRRSKHREGAGNRQTKGDCGKGYLKTMDILGGEIPLDPL